MIYPTDGGWVSVDDRERWDVLHDLGDASGNGMGADFAELMNSGEPRDDRVVSDLNVAGEGPIVGKDDFIPDLAIVRDVRVGETKII